MRPSKRQRKNASAMELVGRLVAVFRRSAGLTQPELADAAGVQPETIASIEQGRRALVPESARDLDSVLDTKGALSTAVDNLPEVDEGHAEQLRHLRACATLPAVCLRIMPLRCRTHAGLDGPFILLETPDYQRVAYSETQRGSLLVSDPDEVSILTQR